MVLMENHRTETDITSPHVSTEIADTSARPHQPPKKTQIRTCIVTREEHHKSELLRFVVNKDGIVYFDQNQKLPGRGLYVTPSLDALKTAIQKKQFSKSAKRQVQVADDLMDQVASTLRQHVLSYISMTKRASVLIASLTNLEKYIKNNKIACYITSSSQDSDGYRKMISKIGSSAPIITEFSNDELSRILGLENAVHLAMKEGELAETFLKKLDLYKELIKNTEGKPKEEQKNG